jgi:hypothetical protein
MNRLIRLLIAASLLCTASAVWAPAQEQDKPADCILHHREPEPSDREGLADVRIIRALYESLERGKAIPIKGAAPEKRPDPDQEIRRPPIAKPEVIHAKSASAERARFRELGEVI